MPRPRPINIWLPWIFSIVLSVIVLVGNVAGSFATGATDAGMIALICFLPMTFFFVAAAQKQTCEHIRDLESRIHQLEAGETAD